MARMHARRRGVSRSRRPVRESAPEWQPVTRSEIIENVERLARDGYTAAQIGVVLRDQFGVPSVRAATGMKMKDILEKKELTPAIPEDLQNLMRRTVQLREHLRTHRQDRHNARGLQLMESRIRRLATYYKKRGDLPADWKYTPQTAALSVE